MISGIYKIENKINNHLYIGKAKDIKHRWSEHRSNAKYASDSSDESHLYNAMKKYGIENFTFEIIEVLTLDDYILNGSEREKFWIKEYNAYLDKNNYNLTEGGEGTLNWKPSEEWKEKQRRIKLEFYQTKEGLAKRKKQSEMMRGKTCFKDHKHTEEWKKQHSQRLKGANNPNYGKHTRGKKCLCIELNRIFNSTREKHQKN